MEASRPAGAGWFTFAGVLFLIAGVANLLWGIGALDDASYLPEDGLLFSNLTFWGWVSIIWGAVSIVGGGLLTQRGTGLHTTLCKVRTLRMRSSMWRANTLALTTPPPCRNRSNARSTPRATSGLSKGLPARSGLVGWLGPSAGYRPDNTGRAISCAVEGVR